MGDRGNAHICSVAGSLPPPPVPRPSVHYLFFRPSCPSEAEINFSFKPPLPFTPLSLSRPTSSPSSLGTDEKR